jgi:RNA polymerase sigma-70 factor (ECF subfamily)
LTWGLCALAAARPWLSVPLSEGAMNRLDEHLVPRGPEAAREILAGLLKRTAQGDHRAFSEFYRHTLWQVAGLVRRVVIDRELSEEVVQEVFIVVWQDAAKYQSAIGSPTAWLMTIAHRRAVDKVRSNQSSRNRDERWASSAPDAYDGVLDAVADKMHARTLIASLACLSALQRESIVLAYFGSLTYREISVKLSVPLPTIKSRIRGGLQRLRTQLEPA